MTTELFRRAAQMLARPARSSDYFGVDLLVMSSQGGRQPEILATLGANTRDEVRAIAIECERVYPRVNRIEAFVASGEVVFALMRVNDQWHVLRRRPHSYVHDVGDAIIDPASSTMAPMGEQRFGARRVTAAAHEEPRARDQ